MLGDLIRFHYFFRLNDLIVYLIDSSARLCKDVCEVPAMKRFLTSTVIRFCSSNIILYAGMVISKLQEISLYLIWLIENDIIIHIIEGYLISHSGKFVFK